MHGSFAIFNVSMWWRCDGKFENFVGTKHSQREREQAAGSYHSISQPGSFHVRTARKIIWLPTHHQSVSDCHAWFARCLSRKDEQILSRPQPLLIVYFTGLSDWLGGGAKGLGQSCMMIVFTFLTPLFFALSRSSSFNFLTKRESRAPLSLPLKRQQYDSWLD